MNKFVLVIFICSVFLFSTIALAETWSSWTNEVKGCGGYSTTCDSCGEYNTISNDVSKTFTLPKGRWTVNIYANNIEASRTECCANMGCTGSIDCSVEIKSIKVTVTVDGNQIFSSTKSGSWLLTTKSWGGCGYSSSTSSISSISGEKEVQCNNDQGCIVNYKWTLSAYGFARGTSTDQYIYAKAQLDARVDYQRVDPSPPTIVITSPIDDSTIPSPFTLSFTITDSQTGVNKNSLSYRIDSGSPVSIPSSRCTGTCENPGQICTCTVSNIAAAEGSHTITVSGSDTDGNVGSASVTFSIGTCSYSISLNPAADNFTDTTRTWSITANDSSSAACPQTINYALESTTSGTCDMSTTRTNQNN